MIYKKCDRCGRIVDKRALTSMGNTSKNSTRVCKICTKYWYSYYITKLDKLRLDPMGWHKKWNEFYCAFLKSGNRKEVVQFT